MSNQKCNQNSFRKLVKKNRILTSELKKINKNRNSAASIFQLTQAGGSDCELMEIEYGNNCPSLRFWLFLPI